MNMIDQLVLAAVIDPCLLIKQNDAGIKITVIRCQSHHFFIGIQRAVIGCSQICALHIKF